ncbi:MAG: hypothetical protein ABH864_05605 [archaeon]
MNNREGLSMMVPAKFAAGCLILASAGSFLVGYSTGIDQKSSRRISPTAVEMRPYSFDANLDGITDLVVPLGENIQTVYIGQADGSYLTVSEAMDGKYGPVMLGARRVEVDAINQRAREFMEGVRGRK